VWDFFPQPKSTVFVENLWTAPSKEAKDACAPGLHKLAAVIRRSRSAA
jgi:hypothetical protein